MTITTHPELWCHRALLPLVHEGNHIIEEECGLRSGTIVAAWGLEPADEVGEKPTLNLIVIDTAAPQAPLVLAAVDNLDALEEAVQQWVAQ